MKAELPLAAAVSATKIQRGNAPAAGSRFFGKRYSDSYPGGLPCPLGEFPDRYQADHNTDDHVRGVT